MPKTIELPFYIDDKVTVDGRDAWIDHVQLTKDGRTLYYVSTTGADGRPVSSWIGEAEITAAPSAPAA